MALEGRLALLERVHDEVRTQAAKFVEAQSLVSRGGSLPTRASASFSRRSGSAGARGDGGKDRRRWSSGTSGPLARQDAAALVHEVYLCTNTCGASEPRSPREEEDGNAKADAGIAADERDVALVVVDGAKALVRKEEEGVSLETLLDRICTDIGPSTVSAATSGRQTVLQPVQSVETSQIQLLVPDDEASAVASTGRSGARGGKQLLGAYSEQVWKLKTNWMKSWKKQLLLVDAEGIAYSKQTSGRDPSVIGWDKLDAACPATQGDVGAKVKLKAESFLLRTRDGRVLVFSAEGCSMTAIKWSKAIVSHALVHAVQHNHGMERAAHFCDLGADVNAALPDGRQYPPLALAMLNGAEDVAQFLLRRGADPSCLLRWSFLMVDRGSTPALVLQLLIDTKKDLNVVSDDAHGWSLLHYLAFEGDFDSVRRLIARVDVPTIRAVNTLGDDSLMLALKRHTEASDTVEKLCLALAKNCDVTRRDKWNDTVLHLAIRRGHEQLTRRLVELGAKIEERDSGGDSALHIAVKLSAFELARWMVEQIEPEARAAVLDMQDERKGDTVFALALKLGQEDLALFFLRHGADCTITSRQWDLAASSARDSPLQVAIKMNMQTLAEAIVSDYCSVDELYRVDTAGVPPLILALRRDMLRLALVMIKAAPRLDRAALEAAAKAPAQASTADRFARPRSFLDVASRQSGNCALHVAVGKGLLMLASTMVDHGADPNVQNGRGHSVLHFCVDLLSSARCTPFHAAIVQRFMGGLFEMHGCAKARDPSARSGGDGINASVRSGDHQYTPLHIAVRRGQHSTASLLLGFDPELGDDLDARGNSSLSLAVLQRDKEMAELLLSRGADVNVVNRDNHCPLHLAVQQDTEDIAVLLLKRGAYPGVWDSKGWCPVHRACAADKAGLVRVLAQHCTQAGHLDLRTDDGRTALMIAVMGGCANAARVLLETGVDLRARVPGTRLGVFHIAADMCQTKKRPFWGSGVAELLIEHPYTSGAWDRDSKGNTAEDARDFVRKRLEGSAGERRVEGDERASMDGDVGAAEGPELQEPTVRPPPLLAFAMAPPAIRAARAAEVPRSPVSPLPDAPPIPGASGTVQERDRATERPQAMLPHGAPAQSRLAEEERPSQRSLSDAKGRQEGGGREDDEESKGSDAAVSPSEASGGIGDSTPSQQQPISAVAAAAAKLGGVFASLASSTSSFSSARSTTSATEVRQALDMLPQAQRVEILERVKAQGRSVAQEWLQTRAGQQMVAKRATAVQRRRPELSFEQAKAEAVKSFIDAHLGQWMFKLVEHRPEDS